MTLAATVMLYDLLLCPVRFHPDHIQEFLTKRKRKTEGWKCAVRTSSTFWIFFTFCLMMQIDHKYRPEFSFPILILWINLELSNMCLYVCKYDDGELNNFSNEYILHCLWRACLTACNPWTFWTRFVLRPSRAGLICKSTWSCTAKTGLLNAPSVMNTSSQGLPGWSTKKSTT